MFVLPAIVRQNPQFKLVLPESMRCDEWECLSVFVCTRKGGPDLHVDAGRCYHLQGFASSSSSFSDCVFDIPFLETYSRAVCPFGSGIPAWRRGSLYSVPIADGGHVFVVYFLQYQSDTSCIQMFWLIS